MMKKYSTRFWATAVVLTLAIGARAEDSSKSQPSALNESMDAVFKLGILAAVATTIEKGGNHLNFDPTAKHVLQISNILYQLGSLADKQVFKDLAYRSVIAAGASIAAAQPETLKLMPNIPFVGESMSRAGTMGQGIVTVALYTAGASLWDIARNWWFSKNSR